MRFGVVVFPGTWSDRDCEHALGAVLGQPVRFVWHQERDLSDLDCVILPGGFSYGDYLRPGAIARFSPVVDAVREFAERGGLVMGICNGFQILCEAGLLPGVLIRNQDLQFHCEWVHLRVERTDTAFTNAARPGQVLRVPISHGEGNYFADPETLARIEANGQVLVRYCLPDGTVAPEANPNGSVNNIAGVMNERGNVFGLMPHPERCCEPVLGGVDGAVLFESLIRAGVGVR
ncbi:MAG: phosphoribosylformylglycinamidine synthase subunit PurQ [Dehalococcoidia bacterium]|nr:MAG: phosphoribosylformylglycinamidine synthase subunit PurQ [Dehalococcoidia bacterium]